MDTLLVGPEGQKPKKNNKWIWYVVAALLVVGAGIGAYLLLSSNKSRSADADDEEADIIETLEDNMVLVKGGSFTMGSAWEGACNGESVEHRVSVSTFYIAKYPVTQEEWEEVMGTNPSQFKGPKRPVENVTWDDCQEFIENLNELTGKDYRLPTEAEWEFAARGGRKSKHYIYAGSNDLDEVAWYKDNSGGKTHKVGQKKPNELGLYDMSGNVWEWCQDYSGDYADESQTDPEGPDYGEERILRGGSWLLDSEWGHRVSCRCGEDPTVPENHVGFRLALSE